LTTTGKAMEEICKPATELLTHFGEEEIWFPSERNLLSSRPWLPNI